MSEALGVGATAVSKAVVGGKFPASWFLVMKSLCRDVGTECPPDLFGMKSTVGKLPVPSDADIQGSGAGKSAGVAP